MFYLWQSWYQTLLVYDSVIYMDIINVTCVIFQFFLNRYIPFLFNPVNTTPLLLRSMLIFLGSH